MESRIHTVENFTSSYLNNKRNLYIYLPPSYGGDQSKHYPVLYMHDGQNIFFPAFNGESWAVDQKADQLIKKGIMEEIIIVGIPNGEAERSNEYNFYFDGDDEVTVPFSKPLQVKGEFYEKFLIKEVKPFIDRSFRTKPEAEFTALMGSSMGGAITYHLGFRNPDVFQMIGVLSPYFYYTNPVTKKETSLIHKFEEKKNLKKIWIDIGGKEAPLIQVSQVRRVVDHLKQIGYEPNTELMYYEDNEAEHTERDWSRRVHAPLIYFFGKKGSPYEMEIEPLQTIHIEEEHELYPVITYESGFLMCDMAEAEFHVEDPNILDIQNSRVLPKKQGETQVTITSKGLEKSIRMQVTQ
ncbi:alpha/beta hydrolase [Halobacillus mangrovi]|uniref:alpha/beta hydrolase n=1 Tax=Halobacillus mangrovi TaxID=402384 RepID=UPI003D97C095